jgi:hypothetical protein
MDSLIYDDYDELCLSERQRVLYIGFISRRCNGAVSAANSRYDRERHGQAGCFHEPLDAEDVEEYKKDLPQTSFETSM